MAASSNSARVDHKQLRQDTRNQRAKHKEIERQITKERSEKAKQADLLIVGSGQAGKTTIIKQLHIVEGKGFSSSELDKFKPVIQANILWSIQDLAVGLQIDGTEQCDAKVLSDVKPLLKMNYRPLLEGAAAAELPLNAEHISIIQAFWQDPAVQGLLSKRNKFQLNDSTEYFLDAVRRLLASDFQPTVNDILRVRNPTTSITEHLFEISKTTIFRVIDVGGQRGERRKWIPFFEDITAILFVTSVIDYDLVMEEDPNTNRMKDSRDLLKSLLGHKALARKNIILFFNKTDLFESKILHSHLADYLPSYDGPRHHAMAALDYIRHVFILAINDDRQIYTHYTRATDTGCMRFIFQVVKVTIMQSMLSRYAIL